MTVTAKQHEQHKQRSLRYHQTSVSRSMEKALQESRKRQLARQKERS